MASEAAAVFEYELKNHKSNVTKTAVRGFFENAMDRVAVMIQPENLGRVITEVQRN